MSDAACAADRAIADAAREGDFRQPLPTRTGPQEAGKCRTFATFVIRLSSAIFINLWAVFECVE
jgi:hypothetical protein